MSYWDGLSENDLRKSQLASLRRLEKKAAITMALEMDDALAAALEQIYAAIVDLRASVLGLPAPVVNLPAPIVNVPPLELPPAPDPPDLSLLAEAVQAVAGLHPGPTAAEIAAALASVVVPPERADGTVLADLLEAIKLLNHRLQGFGGGTARAVGGGSVTLAPGQVVSTSQQLETSDTSTVTAVPSSATVVTLLAANTARKAAYVFNDSTQNLFLKLGAGASAASFSVKLTAGSFYELPTRPTYRGVITGIWAAANGNALVTEMT